MTSDESKCVRSDASHPSRALNTDSLTKDGRDINGETVMGMRVAAWKWEEPNPLPGSDTVPRIVTHWSSCPDHADRLFCEGDVRKLIGAVPAHAWQPIETAPRDGTRVLLFAVPNEVKSLAPIVKVGTWKNLLPGYDGWRWEGAEGPSYQPTHWMPLPPAPSEGRLSSSGAREAQRSGATEHKGGDQ